MIIEGNIVEPSSMRFGQPSSMMMRNPTHPIVYLPILKNAHKYTSYVFQSFNYVREYAKSQDEYICRGTKKLVILRDPLDRWYSGVIQFMTAQQILEKQYEMIIDFTNRDLCRLLTSIISIDTHTRPQVNYLNGVDTDECTFLKFDSELENNLQYFCHINLGGRFDPKLIEKNPSLQGMTTSNKSEKRSILVEQLKENIVHYGYENRLIEYYQKDIELFNHVKFLSISNKGEKND
jgi:hypothetical protein